jgi:vancomycin resistance protein VanJ
VLNGKEVRDPDLRLRTRWDLLAIAPAALAACALLAAIWPPNAGPAALAMILEEHLLIGALVVLAPIAALARARLLGVALAVVLIVGVVLFGSEWISPPGGGRHDLTVMTWNVEYGVRSPADQAAQLEGVDADVIALEEVEPDAAAAVEADAVITARFPYRAMAPRPLAWGLAVLSRYPVGNVRSTSAPAMLELDVATPRGAVYLIVGHPAHADIGTVTPLRLPVSYEPAYRDSEIARIRERVQAALTASATPVLLVGDFNVAPTEAEYRVLTESLRDTHVEVGEGPGWTWRPSRLTFLPFGLLRIDLQLSAGPISPSSTWTDCSLPGDHCRLFAAYEID